MSTCKHCGACEHHDRCSHCGHCRICGQFIAAPCFQIYPVVYPWGPYIYPFTSPNWNGAQPSPFQVNIDTTAGSTSVLSGSAQTYSGLPNGAFLVSSNTVKVDAATPGQFAFTVNTGGVA